MTIVQATLVPHPTTQAGSVEGIGVHVALTSSGRLSLHYVLRAPLETLAIAPPAPTRFRDGLWRRSCFEAFVRPEGERGYLEFNFAPSREWAAYSFTAQRQGMAKLEHALPALSVGRTDARLDVHAAVELAGLYDRSTGAWRVLRLGLAAVVEDASGGIAYWALRHPLERPDFHHPGGFVLALS